MWWATKRSELDAEAQINELGNGKGNAIVEDMKVTWGATVEGYGVVIFLKKDTARIVHDVGGINKRKEVKRRKASQERIAEENAKPKIQGVFNKTNFVGESASGAANDKKVSKNYNYDGGEDAMIQKENTIMLKMQ